ncbi:hypothetical protein D3C72_2289100 [compost metagenome]
MVDMVVHRHNLRSTIGSLAAILTNAPPNEAITASSPKAITAQTSMRDAAVAAEGDDDIDPPAAAAHAE